MNKKIFLIVPYTRSYTQRLPLGLMTISSYLLSKGIENEILDYKGISEKEAFNKIKEVILKEKPKIIGLTCLVSEVGVVKDICAFAGENSKESTIIIGGPHPTISPQHFVDMEVKFDYLVVGEGENTFYELAKTIMNNGEIEQVKGIAYKKGGKLHFNKPRELIQNLDELPMPAYDKVNMEYYCRPNVWAIRPIYLSSFNLFTSRGCPYNCNFCVAHTIFGRKVRYISPEKVVEHIEHVVKNYNVDALYFADESFTISKQRVYDIFNLLKKKNIKILWGCETRVNLLDEELLRFMKENGCMQIDFGIESGSEKMLKIMNKQTTINEIKKIGNICRRIKLRHLANMMVNLPGETLDDIEQSLSLVKEMRYNVVLWNTYTPFPGSNFGGNLDIDDLDLLLQYPSKTTFDLLEKKYKFASYDKKITDVLDYLYANIFHPKYFKFSLKFSYWTSVFRTVSFLFDHRYILQLLKSKRKMSYITNIFKQRTSI